MDLETTTFLHRALGDASRLRALLALQQHELCLCQIVELLELAPSTVSKSMSILKRAGLVESRKQGRWVYYRALAAEEGGRVPKMVQGLASTLTGDDTVKADQRRLHKILRVDPEELCRRQMDKRGSEK